MSLRSKDDIVKITKQNKPFPGVSGAANDEHGDGYVGHGFTAGWELAGDWAVAETNGFIGEVVKKGTAAVWPIGPDAFEAVDENGSEKSAERVHDQRIAN